VATADPNQRNMTIHQIVGAYNEGLVTADTYIWKEGMADWQTLAEVREVANALHAAARPAAAQPAAVRRGNHNSSADLFGRIHTAGGEDDITTSAPEPAATMTAGTGARNESSVLFSLSALTGTTATATAAPTGSAKRRTSDDSGLIDLQALTATDTAGTAGGFGAAPGAFGASPLISAPLGGVSGPALGGGIGAGYGSGRSGSKWGLIVAALLLAVVMIGGTLVFVKGGSGEPEQPTSALDRAAAAAPEHAAQPAKEPTAPREPEGTTTPEPARPDPAGNTRPVAVEELPTAGTPEPTSAKPTSPVAKPSTPRTSRPSTPKPVAALPPAPVPAPEPAAAPKPAAPKPAAAPAEKKRCECKPSDLLCAMKCSAKKP
jgi:GYF domain 2